MRLWGYRYIVTPSVELLSVLSQGLGEHMQKQLFKFTDYDGEILAFVPEKTVQVARVVSNELRHTPPPFRVCYSAPVLRNDFNTMQGRRETYQVGAELIGASGAQADAEILALALVCLKLSGLSDLRLFVGHAGFLSALLDSSIRKEKTRELARLALYRHDFVQLRQVLDADPKIPPKEKDVLLSFPRLRGDITILNQIESALPKHKALKAINELKLVLEALEPYGVIDQISIDLGMIRDLGYYTGIIFSAFSEWAGVPLLSGGRYDGLLSKFGRQAPAVGFVLHPDQMMMAKQRSGKLEELAALNVAVCWKGAGFKQAVGIAKALRTVGVEALVEHSPKSESAAASMIERLGVKAVIQCEGVPEVSIISKGKTIKVPDDDVGAGLLGMMSR